jgi:hypothetical protein
LEKVVQPHEAAAANTNARTFFRIRPQVVAPPERCKGLSVQARARLRALRPGRPETG